MRSRLRRCARARAESRHANRESTCPSRRLGSRHRRGDRQLLSRCNASDARGDASARARAHPVQPARPHKSAPPPRVKPDDRVPRARREARRCARRRRPRSQRPRVAEHRHDLARRGDQHPRAGVERRARRVHVVDEPPRGGGAPRTRTTIRPASRGARHPAPTWRPARSERTRHVATGTDDPTRERAGQHARRVEPARAGAARAAAARARAPHPGRAARPAGSRPCAPPSGRPPAAPRGTSARRPARAPRPGRPSAPTPAENAAAAAGHADPRCTGNPHRPHPGRSHGSARTQAAHRRSSARTSARRQPGHDGGATSASSSANTDMPGCSRESCHGTARASSQLRAVFVPTLFGQAQPVDAGWNFAPIILIALAAYVWIYVARWRTSRAEGGARAAPATGGSRCGCSGSRCCSSR